MTTKVMLLDFLWRLARPTAVRPIRLDNMKQKLKNKPSWTLHPLLVAKSNMRKTTLIRVDIEMTRVATSHRYRGLFRNDQRNWCEVDWLQGSTSTRIKLAVSASCLASVSSFWPLQHVTSGNSPAAMCPSVAPPRDTLFRHRSSWEQAADVWERVSVSSVGGYVECCCGCDLLVAVALATSSAGPVPAVTAGHAVSQPAFLSPRRCGRWEDGNTGEVTSMPRTMV